MVTGNHDNQVEKLKNEIRSLRSELVSKESKIQDIEKHLKKVEEDLVSKNLQNKRLEEENIAAKSKIISKESEIQDMEKSWKQNLLFESRKTGEVITELMTSKLRKPEQELGGTLEEEKKAAKSPINSKESKIPRYNKTSC